MENILKIKRNPKTNCKFSILIPTWNNLEYLKLCVRSIQKNSTFNHQIIIIINDGSDGTLDWVKDETDFDYIHSEENIGICYGLNEGRTLVETNYLCYVNDDMYVLPKWDLELANEIERIGHKKFMLSATMIEPTDTGNSCVVIKNYGQDIADFQEEKLLNEYAQLAIPDWSGSTWPPNVVHVDLWDLVGGLSVEFSPGAYSDPDFSKKLWDAGVRYFKGVGNSLVYHFGSKSTQKIKSSNGKNLFLRKWGISAKTFSKYYLRSGERFRGELQEVELNWFVVAVNTMKRLIR